MNEAVGFSSSPCKVFASSDVYWQFIRVLASLHQWFLVHCIQIQSALCISILFRIKMCLAWIPIYRRLQICEFWTSYYWSSRYLMRCERLNGMISDSWVYSVRRFGIHLHKGFCSSFWTYLWFCPVFCNSSIGYSHRFSPSRVHFERHHRTRRFCSIRFIVLIFRIALIIVICNNLLLTWAIQKLKGYFYLFINKSKIK